MLCNTAVIHFVYLVIIQPIYLCPDFSWFGPLLLRYWHYWFIPLLYLSSKTCWRTDLYDLCVISSSVLMDLPSRYSSFLTPQFLCVSSNHSLFISPFMSLKCRPSLFPMFHLMTTMPLPPVRAKGIIKLGCLIAYLMELIALRD